MDNTVLSGKYVEYSEYKDSGVDWLDGVPAHWFSTKTKYGYDVTLGKMLQKEPKSSEDKLWPYLKAVNVQAYGVSIEQVGKMWFSPSELRSLKLIDGDVLISEGGDVGRAAIWRSELPECYIQNAINRGRPKNNQSSRFLFYWINMLKGAEYIDILCNKATIAHYTAEKVENSPLFLPHDEEAETIANFLDHETAKIDTLIEKQQQLIALLKEKRQAVISHAVTKGLNPNAPMRDSGVEWLGEVPEHWEVARIKYHTTVFEQGWSPQCDSRPAEDGEYGVLKVGCVNYGAFRYLENKALPKELDPKTQYLLKSGDLLISRANTKELVGSAAVVDGNYDNLILCDKLYRLRLGGSVNAQLIAYYLALPVIRQQIELEATGASHSMQNIGQSTIKELLVLIPPTEEADKLVLKIKCKIDLFNMTLDKVGRQIVLLQERRTALISAAVTGKIDVRNW